MLNKVYGRGLLNRYHKNMPISERITKDIAQAWLEWRHRRYHGGKAPVLLCYPHFPSRGSMLYKIARHLRWNITNKPSRHFDWVMYWEYATFRQEYALAEKWAHRYPVINLHNRDISKEKVDALHQEIFGYRTRIDPTQFRGKAVRKSDINALHNYAVIDCPIAEREEGAFYQILIDNEVENGTRVEDIRVPIIKGCLPFAYRKHRAIDDRFKNPIYCKPLPIESLLSAAEIAQVEALAKAFALNFGEMDVLRHRGNGEIYVIDVNNTPQGPPSGISAADAEWVIAEMARLFAERLGPP